MYGDVHRLLRLSTAAGLLVSIAFGPRVNAGPAIPTSVQGAQLSGELSSLVPFAQVTNDEFVVHAPSTPLRNGILVAKKLRFETNGKLIVDDGNGPVRIRADEIRVEGPGAEITWIRPPPPSDIPPDRGKAPSGPYGRDLGASGGPGLDGDRGNTGVGGANAPDVILVFKSISGTQLTVDLSGGAGGPGGRGQDGGDGGAGAPGTPAVSSVIDCKVGPGQGGNGGTGGAAGPGGDGGQGGNGGSLFVITLNNQLSAAGSDIVAFTDGGPGGTSGLQGNPGKGGPGGPEGALALPLCGSGNRVGRTGPNKVSVSSQPRRAVSGAPGSFLIAPLNADTANRIFPPTGSAAGGTP